MVYANDQYAGLEPDIDQALVQVLGRVGHGKLQRLRAAVGEAVVELMRPIREETEKLLGDKAYLESIYKEGAEKASYLANKTIRKVYKKVGFVAR